MAAVVTGVRFARAGRWKAMAKVTFLAMPDNVRPGPLVQYPSAITK